MDKQQQRALLSTSVAHAKECLSRDGNRLSMILSLLFVLVSAAPYLLLYQAESLVVASLYLTPRGADIWFAVLYGVTAFSLTLFLILPLWQGYVRFAMAIARGNAPEVSLLLSPFGGDGAYSRALWVSASLLLRSTTAFFAATAALHGAKTWFAESPASLLITVPLVILLTLGGFFWCLSLYGTAYMAWEDPRMPLREVQARMRRQRKPFRTVPYRYAFCFLPRVLLGLLTLGIYLLADVIPLMVLTYCEDMRARDAQPDNDHMILEDIKNHE